MTRETIPVTRAGENEPRDVERWAPLSSLRQEIDELFDELTSMTPFRRRRRSLQPSGLPAFGWTIRVPAVDVVEKDKEIQIRADLPPGMDQEDVDVRLSDGALTISGEKKEERDEEEGDYYLSERRYGSFRRSIPLPDGIDHDKVGASFRKGVLTIHLPKTAEAREKSKRIEVKAEK